MTVSIRPPRLTISRHGKPEFASNSKLFEFSGLQLQVDARIPFAQARDGLFFSRFGRIHPRFHTPGFAIVMQALWAGVLIVTGSYETLSTYTILSAWVFYTLSVVAVWVLRRKMPEAARPYRMWGYPATLWIF